MRIGGRRDYDAGPAPADLLRLEPSGRPRRSWPVGLTGLFVLACLYTLRAADDFLMPLAVGVMVYLLLVPLVRALKRIGLPEGIGAAVVVLGLVVSVALSLYALSWPAASWMARAPDGLRRVETKLRPVLRRVQKITQTAQQMEDLTTGAAPTAAREVQVKEPGIGAAFVGGMQSLVGGAAIVLTLVYFLLASGDTFLRKIVQTLPRLQDRKRAVGIVREMESQISSYLLLTTVINFTFGVVVAATLWMIGMPNPMLWGAVAAVTNFIPYLGGILATVVIGLAALLAFDDLWRALLVPTLFFLLNTVEGYVVTPTIMGRRFTLDPAVLFVGLLFWWFVWGTAGALLAVPMMAAFKIFCERVESLQRVAAFLGDGVPVLVDTPVEPVAEPETSS